MMDFKQITNHFDITGNVSEICPFGSGHINDTYLIRTNGESDPNYLLQRINHFVFRDVDGLMENISKVTKQIRRQLRKSEVQNLNRCSLKLYRTKQGRNYHEENGTYWRIFNFIEEHKVFDKAPNTETAYESALMFGRFLTLLTDLNTADITETIPDFHNVKYRYDTFIKVLDSDIADRVRLVKDEIKYIFSSYKNMSVIKNLGEKAQIPLRAVHNDTKINNVLFDSDNKGLCVIDLDTVMPGYVHYDFGDGVRTCANTGEEDEEDLKNVGFDLDMFEAFSNGYTDAVKSTVKHIELSSLAYAAPLFPFIMGLRFLTDYLSGDVYYKIKYDDHNLVRAKAQFRLAQDGEKKLPEMKRIIHRLIPGS